MRNRCDVKKRMSGFSTMELIIVVAILGTLAAIAIPGFAVWLPDSRLKGAARDLYSNIQLAKLMAVRQNADCAIVFDPGVSPGRYFVCSGPGADGTWNGPPALGGDDVVEKTVDLSDYGSNVDFGSGNATDDIPGSGAPPADSITYSTPTDIALFTPRGTVINPGVSGSYVYLTNSKGSSYGVGTPSLTGVVLLRRWHGGTWD